MTVRVETRLVDGRELIYYDREPGQDRSARDQRTDLPAAETNSQIRWNPLFRDYTVIAEHRQERTYKPPADLCPLCPSRDGKHTEIPAADYEVAVFENRFPSLSTPPSGLCLSNHFAAARIHIEHQRSCHRSGRRLLCFRRSPPPTQNSAETHRWRE